MTMKIIVIVTIKNLLLLLQWRKRFRKLNGRKNVKIVEVQIGKNTVAEFAELFSRNSINVLTITVIVVEN